MELVNMDYRGNSMVTNAQTHTHKLVWDGKRWVEMDAKKDHNVLSCTKELVQQYRALHYVRTEIVSSSTKKSLN